MSKQQMSDVAVCCSVLQCVAVTSAPVNWYLRTCQQQMSDVAVCCSLLQCVAVRCSALQCVAITSAPVNWYLRISQQQMSVPVRPSPACIHITKYFQKLQINSQQEKAIEIH